MAARSVGSLFIDIEARTARMEADLGKARNLLKKLSADTAVMSRGFNQAFTIGKAAIAGFVSIAAIRGIKTMVMGTLEQTRAQMKLAEATGLSVNDLKAYDEASEHLGVTNLDMAKTMKELFALQSDVTSGNKEAVKQITQMGYSVEQFASLAPAKLFEGVVGGISRISDVSSRAALSQKVFSKEATNLSSLLSQGTGAITNARAEMERLGQTVSELDMARVTVTMQAVAELGDRWETFKRKLTMGLTPLIYATSQKLADILGSMDVEKLAAKISHYALVVAGFILTIPKRVQVMLKEVQLMWYAFIAKFDTGDSESMLGKMFGTQAENRAQVQTLIGDLAKLKAEIKTLGSSLETDFNAKVEEAMKKIAQLPAVVTRVSNAISPWMKEMVDAFSGSFQKLADITDQFIDGEAIKFGDFLRDLVKAIVKTFFKISIINPLLNSLFGSMMGGTAGGWWTNLPGIQPGKAAGGPVMAGDTRMVGENGPELVRFGRSGTVVPNNSLVNRSSGGDAGPTIVINQTFSSGLQRAELSAIIPQIVQQSKAAVADAYRRGGTFRSALAR